MIEENKNTWDRQRLKSRVRAVGFVMLLGTICYLAVCGDATLQDKAIGAVTNLSFLAAGIYYKATGDQDNKKKAGE